MHYLLFLSVFLLGCATLSEVDNKPELPSPYSHSVINGESVHQYAVDLNSLKIEPIKSAKLSLTTALAKEHQAIAAINGGFFESSGKSAGLLMINKVISGYQNKPRAALGWAKSGEVLLDRIQYAKKNPKFVSLTGHTTPSQWKKMDFIVGGTPLLVYESKMVTDFGPEKVREHFLTLKHARTAICVKDAKHWILVVVDGSSSLQISGERRGFTMTELVQFMSTQLQCRFAMNLDGGGSTALVVDGALINKPTFGERPVSDAIGVFKR